MAAPITGEGTPAKNGCSGLNRKGSVQLPRAIAKMIDPAGFRHRGAGPSGPPTTGESRRFHRTVASIGVSGSRQPNDSGWGGFVVDTEVRK